MKAFIYRLKFALQGWVSFFQREANGQIQLFIAVMVIVAGFVLRVSITEWMILLSCIGVVITLEMINTAIEKICDHVNPQIHPTIKVIKDIAAGAVLWSAVIASIIGLIIFIPRFILLLSH
jgi:diacylglycerol kinase